MHVVHGDVRGQVPEILVQMMKARELDDIARNDEPDADEDDRKRHPTAPGAEARRRASIVGRGLLRSRQAPHAEQVAGLLPLLPASSPRMLAGKRPLATH